MLSNLIFIIPILGLIAGLSLSITIPIFMIGTLYSISNNMQITYKKFRVEFVFFLLLLLSCFWSINIQSSLVSVVKIFALSLASYTLIINAEFVSNRLSLDTEKIVLSIILSLAVFYFEFISNGLISSWFRAVVQRKENHEFYLHYLDRGCSLLALFSWVGLAKLMKDGKNIRATSLYLIALITLYLSDSLSGFVGFALGGFAFLLTKYSFFRNPKTLSSILIVGSICFLSISATIKPYKLSDDLAFLPISAKHRLFIWSFVADNIMKKPILGWGHNSSRDFDVKESDIIEYANYSLSPLPVHPHNNISQITLENGFVGLIIYMILMCRYLFRWNSLFDSHNNNVT